MMTSQCKRMEDMMASGRWTSDEQFMAMRIPDYRRRMCDLAEKYPGRYESRTRPGTRVKDRRDIWTDSVRLNGIKAYCENVLDRYGPDSKGYDEFTVELFHSDAGSCAINVSRLYEDFAEEVTRVFEKLTDPFRTVAKK